MPRAQREEWQGRFERGSLCSERSERSGRVDSCAAACAPSVAKGVIAEPIFINLLILDDVPPDKSLPWWLQPPFVATLDERRYRRRSNHHDYQRPNRRYMITISASRLLPPLSRITGSVTQGAVVELTPFGECFSQALDEWQQFFHDQLSLAAHVIMPDHVHFSFTTIAPLKSKFSTMIASLMGKSTNRLKSLLNSDPRCYDLLIDTALWRLRKYLEKQRIDPSMPIQLPDNTTIPINDIKFFSRGFTDSIALADNRWKAQQHYIADNPRRLLFKRLTPDYLIRKWELTFGDSRLTCFGNVLLLKNPYMEVVRYSSEYTPEQRLANKARWDECIRSGGVLISPFIHPEEKAAYNNACDNNGLIIRLCNNGFSAKYSPSKTEFELIAEKRLLLISPYRYSSRQQDMKRSIAMDLNDLAVKLAEGLLSAPGSARLHLLE